VDGPRTKKVATWPAWEAKTPTVWMEVMASCDFLVWVIAGIKVQLEKHSSLSSLLPSSHCSVPFIMLLPQIVEQMFSVHAHPS